MAKPTIVTRAGKGSALTWTEGDSNLTNLRDATVSIKAGSAGTSVVSDLNGEITLVAGTNITLTGDNTAKTVTIDASGGSSFDPASPGAIGGTTPNTGAFTTLSATTTGTSGALSITYNPATASGAAINASGKDSQGGTGYFDFFKITNTTSGATNPNKTFRVNNTGQFEIIDSTYSNVRLSLTDAGALTTTSIENTPIGATTASTGRFTTLTTNSFAVGTSAGTVTTGGVGALTLNTNSGTSTGSVVLSSGANGNITITPNGTGKTVTYGLNYRESVLTLGTTTVTSYSFAPSSGNIQTITVNASSFTLNTTAIAAGDSVTILLTGGTTAPSAITQGSGTWKWAGASKALSGVTGTTDIVSIFYDGTTHYASINKGFV